MTDLARTTARLWATILVAWALVVTALGPAAAMPIHAPDAAGILCLTDGHRDGAPAGDHARHGLLCCILCTQAATAAVPAPDASAGAVVPPEPRVLAVAAPLDAAALPRAPPAGFPAHPRAPPIAA